MRFKLSTVFFLLLIVFFVYFRVTPIINQTIPYTFDQGRDFLKAEEIVRDLNPAIYGPTTGLPGIFHGVMWYYFLSIPYLLTGGNPLGFYFFIVAVNVISVTLFSLFLRREFNMTSALLFIFLVATSSYFIPISFFPISSVQTLPVILLLMYSIYMFFKKQEPRHGFLICLSLTAAFEAEVPFGVFLIPACIAALLVTRQIKLFFQSKKHMLYALAGLVIPLIPRILSEIISRFSQTKAVINFLFAPKLHSPHSLEGAFMERASLFWNYYKSIFFEQNLLLLSFITLVALIGLFVGYKKAKSFQKRFLIFSFTLPFCMFIFSLFYKDTFWANYFEGLPYFFIIPLVMGYFLLKDQKKPIFRGIVLATFVLLSVMTFQKIYADMQPKHEEPQGMIEQVGAVEYIYRHVGSNKFCARIYTPPVIPHTYNYLFSFYSRKPNHKLTSHDYINNECYYIFEKDPYEFRIDKFRKEHIPVGAKLISKENISKSIWVEHWRLYEKK